MENYRKIGLLVERARDFGRRLCEGVITYAQNKAWEIRYLAPEDFPKAKHTDFDGFIARVTSRDLAKTLAASGKPVVDVFYSFPDYGFSIVKTKHETVGRLAAEHFLDRHFKNFAYCPYGAGKTSAYCKNAFVLRLKREGLSCSVFSSASEIAYPTDRRDVISDRISRPKDIRALRRWLKELPKPVALFAPDDLRAWQVLEACHDIGFPVPDAVAILGLDNDLLICGCARPMLSSIDPNTLEIGRTAADTLDRLMTTDVKKPVIRQIPPVGVVTRASTEIYPVEPPWLSDALIFINREAPNRISAADVFAHLGRSHTLVTRAFARVLHTTVQKEISRTRLETACRLLRTSKHPLDEIARLSGYATYGYFMQSFKSALHQSPGLWRESHARPS